METGDNPAAECSDEETIGGGERELWEESECNSGGGGCGDICEGCDWEVPCAYPL